MRNGFTETAAWSPSSNFYRMKPWGGRYVAKSVANELTTTKRIVTEKFEKISVYLNVTIHRELMMVLNLKFSHTVCWYHF